MTNLPARYVIRFVFWDILIHIQPEHYKHVVILIKYYRAPTTPYP